MVVVPCKAEGNPLPLKPDFDMDPLRCSHIGSRFQSSADEGPSNEGKPGLDKARPLFRYWGL